MADIKDNINTLADKAAGAEHSIEAMQYAQAAQNLAGVLMTVASAEREFGRDGYERHGTPPVFFPSVRTFVSDEDGK